MESPADLWTSLYFVPVVGVFALAGVVYYLSFRSKEDDNQSLRIYLNVLSGDDEKNRKAAKKVRKFGTLTKRLTTVGSGVDGDGDCKQVGDDSDTEKQVMTVHANPPVERSLSTRKRTQSSGKKTDPPAITPTYSAVPLSSSPRTSGPPTYSSSCRVGLPPHSQVPEVVTDVSGEPAGVTPTPVGVSCDGGEESGQDGVAEGATLEETVSGWQKASSRREKKHSVGLENKTPADNYSTASDESRPSFRNSNSSRTSSPYRNNHHYNGHHGSHHANHRAPTSPKFTAANTNHKSPHLLQRPDHLKLEPLASATNLAITITRHTESAAVPSTASNGPRPTVLTSPEAVTKKMHANGGVLSFRTITVARGCAANDRLRSAPPLPPGQVDMCVQTEENEEYPSPLQGLRQVDVGKPRFVICHDFQMQVDLDGAENGTDSESELRFEDGDKILYSSGASLSSGEGSSRVTPIDDDCLRDFTMTAEKSQGVHPRGQYYHSRIISRHSAQSTFPSRYSDPSHYSQNINVKHGGGGGGGGGGGDGTYYVGHGDLRTCRVEKGASWIDNSSRRVVARQAPCGRWRN